MNSNRTSGAPAAILAVLALCAIALPAFAQSTTSTSTTTSTTLLPHPYSKATNQCIRTARVDRRACTNDEATCTKGFETAFGNCFAAGAGAKCATKCVTNRVTCLGKAPTTERTCHKTCRTNRAADVKACRRIAAGDGNIWAGGDGSCLTSAAATFDLCSFVCDEAAHDCEVNFRFCIADCANL